MSEPKFILPNATQFQKDYLLMITETDSDGLDAPATFISGETVYTISAKYHPDFEFNNRHQQKKISLGFTHGFKKVFIRFCINSEKCAATLSTQQKQSETMTEKKQYQLDAAVTKEQLNDELYSDDFQREALRLNQIRKKEQQKNASIEEEEYLEILHGNNQVEEVVVAAGFGGGVVAKTWVTEGVTGNLLYIISKTKHTERKDTNNENEQLHTVTSKEMTQTTKLNKMLKEGTSETTIQVAPKEDNSDTTAQEVQKKNTTDTESTVTPNDNKGVIATAETTL